MARIASLARILSVAFVLCAVACGGSPKPAPALDACTGRVLALGESCATR